MHKSWKEHNRECLHSLLCSFYDLYTAPAVSEMKQSGIELKAQLAQASAAPAVSEMKQSGIELKAQLAQASVVAAPAVSELKAQLVQALESKHIS